MKITICYPKTFKLPVCYKALSWQERIQVRDEYITLQKGFCYYCGEPLTEKPHITVRRKKLEIPHLYPETFFEHPIHLHHDHETGLTIGAVHNYCNAVLHEYEQM